MQQIHCISCGKESQDIVSIENGYMGRRCKCGLIYFSPGAAEDQVWVWYDSGIPLSFTLQFCGYLRSLEVSG